MARFICHHMGKFFEWSTIVDAPVSDAMSREEFEKRYQEKYGSEGMRELPARLERAIRQGTSCMDPMSLHDLFVANRAGPNESEATFDEIIAGLGISPT